MDLKNLKNTWRVANNLLTKNQIWNNKIQQEWNLVLAKKLSPHLFLKRLPLLCHSERMSASEVDNLKRYFSRILHLRGYIMKFGLDLGTKNIVLSYIDSEGKIKYRREVNGFYKLPNDNAFAKNMLISA